MENCARNILASELEFARASSFSNTPTPHQSTYRNRLVYPLANERPRTAPCRNKRERAPQPARSNYVSLRTCTTFGEELLGRKLWEWMEPESGGITRRSERWSVCVKGRSGAEEPRRRTWSEQRQQRVDGSSWILEQSLSASLGSNWSCESVVLTPGLPIHPRPVHESATASLDDVQQPLRSTTRTASFAVLQSSRSTPVPVRPRRVSVPAAVAPSAKPLELQPAVPDHVHPAIRSAAVPGAAMAARKLPAALLRSARAGLPARRQLGPRPGVSLWSLELHISRLHSHHSKTAQCTCTRAHRRSTRPSQSTRSPAATRRRRDRARPLDPATRTNPTTIRNLRIQLLVPGPRLFPGRERHHRLSELRRQRHPSATHQHYPTAPARQSPTDRRRLRAQCQASPSHQRTPTSPRRSCRC